MGAEIALLHGPWRQATRPLGGVDLALGHLGELREAEVELVQQPLTRVWIDEHLTQLCDRILHALRHGLPVLRRLEALESLPLLGIRSAKPLLEV